MAIFLTSGAFRQFTLDILLFLAVHVRDLGRKPIFTNSWTCFFNWSVFK